MQKHLQVQAAVPEEARHVLTGLRQVTSWAPRSSVLHPGCPRLDTVTGALAHVLF